MQIVKNLFASGVKCLAFIAMLGFIPGVFAGYEVSHLHLEQMVSTQMGSIAGGALISTGLHYAWRRLTRKEGFNATQSA